VREAGAKEDGDTSQTKKERKSGAAESGRIEETLVKKRKPSSSQTKKGMQRKAEKFPIFGAGISLKKKISTKRGSEGNRRRRRMQISKGDKGIFVGEFVGRADDGFSHGQTKKRSRTMEVGESI